MCVRPPCLLLQPSPILDSQPIAPLSVGLLVWTSAPVHQMLLLLHLLLSLGLCSNRQQQEAVGNDGNGSTTCLYIMCMRHDMRPLGWHDHMHTNLQELLQLLPQPRRLPPPIPDAGP